MIFSLLPEYTILTFQTLLYPLTNFILPFFNQTCRNRKKFERKNLTDAKTQSFRLSQQSADYCFEISSEGEMEQIAPLLVDLLKCGLNIELIFCSPSVEKKVEKLSGEFSNLRFYRMPLLTFSWFGQSALKWSTAKSVFLCRYDFFPELMIMVKKHRGQLISASLVGKKKIPWYLKRYYHFFSQILTATATDKERFQKELSFRDDQVLFLELRFIQIERRLSQKDQALKTNEVSAHYCHWLQEFSQKKIVIGNMWPEEIALLSTTLLEDIKKKQIHLAIFPHLLSGPAYNQLIDNLKVILHDIPLLIVDERTSLSTLKAHLEKTGVVLFAIKGMLCEYYTLFTHAYIGGGHGRSIHSILEPYLAGPMLFCGPGTHRSTEFLLIKDSAPNEVVVVEKLEAFYENILQYSVTADFNKRLELIKEMNQRYKIFFEHFTRG